MATDCLNGCLDYAYGEDETVLKHCTCTPQEIMAAVDRLLAKGISVEFVAVRKENAR